MVPSGAGTREGMEDTSYPSLCLILFVSASRVRRTLQREKEERELERRKGRGRWFVNIHYVCAEKGEAGEKRGKMEAKRDGGNTRVESVRDARHARIYNHESACKEDWRKRKLKKMCRRTNVVGRLN